MDPPWLDDIEVPQRISRGRSDAQVIRILRIHEVDSELCPGRSRSMEQERSVRCEVALGPGKCSDDPAAVIDNVQVLGYAVGLAQHPEPVSTFVRRIFQCSLNPADFSWNVP